ncbi:molecular chaperone DnaJ [Paraburkholderia tropica]|uniref:zinc finger domain-containing protein n=1 Tax=Paraburkholderia tropica TaxID=92647 RepID=UPI0016048A28|nr:molecular chaperone DnaJ [Paraburkholderia tropica]
MSTNYDLYDDEATFPCATCHGRGSDVNVTCPECRGTGYDPNEDNPFAQCHRCYGEGEVVLDICPSCGGTGEGDASDECGQ